MSLSSSLDEPHWFTDHTTSYKADWVLTNKYIRDTHSEILEEISKW